MANRVEVLDREESRVIRQVLRGRLENFEILRQRHQDRLIRVVSVQVYGKREMRWTKSARNL